MKIAEQIEWVEIPIEVGSNFNKCELDENDFIEEFFINSSDEKISLPKSVLNFVKEHQIVEQPVVLIGMLPNAKQPLITIQVGSDLYINNFSELEMKGCYYTVYDDWVEVYNGGIPYNFSKKYKGDYAFKSKEELKKVIYKVANKYKNEVLKQFVKDNKLILGSLIN